MLHVDITVDDRLPDINEHEHWHHWVDESNPVLSWHQVKLSVSLEGREWEPPSQSRWLGSECNSLFSETLDILVNSALELWFHLHSLNHLNYLLLLLVNRRVLGANLGEALGDFVRVT